MELTFKEGYTDIPDKAYAVSAGEKLIEQTEGRSKLYTQTFDYAQKNGEIKEFQTSHRDNMSCLCYINARAEIYALDGIMDKFLQSLIEKYGTERPLYVLSRTVQNVDNMTFSPQTRQIADKFSYPDKDSVHSFTHLYVTDIKPAVIDVMICKLIEERNAHKVCGNILEAYVKSKCRAGQNIKILE